MTYCKTKALTDDLSKGLQNWTLRGTSCQGKWRLTDHRLVYEPEPGSTCGRGFIALRDRFLGLKNLQFHFSLSQIRPCEVDIWLRSFSFTSILRLHFAEGGKQTARYLHNNSKTLSGISPLACVDLPDGLLRADGENTYRVELQEQTYILFLNGQEVLRYTDAELPTEAPVCIHLKHLAGGSSFSDFSATAEDILPLEARDESADTEPTVYTMQLPADRSRPYGFTEIPGEQDWIITDLNGTPVYGAEKKEKYTQTWLFGFEKDPTITAKAVCNAPAANAQCGILARFAAEGSYLRAGYDFGRKAWFITACAGKPYSVQEFIGNAPALKPGALTALQLKTLGDTAELYVNGALAVSAQGLYNVSFGRIGLFAEDTDFYATEFACVLPSGGKITDGVVEQTIDPEKYYAHFEIERLDQDTLYGQFKDSRYISYDCGLHWEQAPASFDNTCPGYCYPSMHRRQSDGKFIQLLQKREFLLQESDDLQNWTDVCHVIPPEQVYRPDGELLSLIHVSSFTELPMPNGGTRLFLPIATRRFRFDGAAHGHSTKVYYSDDGGKTWQAAKKNVEDLERFTPWHGNMSWCESKIVRCSDGRLRMLCTRSMAPCVYYADSFDHGETWTEYGELPELPTPNTSFAICADPSYPGTYLMIYINAQPPFHSTMCPRTRLTLVRTDGLTFTPLMDIERLNNVEAPEEGSAELYQILDPCINAFEDYIFMGFGRSDDIGGFASHNAQHIRFVRIDRAAAGI